MNWMKLSGVFLILFAGTGIGTSVGHRMKERELALEGILRMLTLIKEEIRFGKISLKETFHRVGEKLQGEFRTCMLEIAEEMEMGECASFSSLFSFGVTKTIGTLGISREELQTLCDLGTFLGYLDQEAQLRELERTIAFFQERLGEIQKELSEKVRLSRNLGILGAFLLVLLVF